MTMPMHVHCAASVERLGRHNRLCDSICNIASQAGLDPRKEERDILAGTQEMLGDIYLPGWCDGRDASLDITVVTLIQANVTAKAAATNLYAAEEAHKRKLLRYYDNCKSAGVEFIPLALESFGAWHPKALNLIKLLSRQLARQLGQEEGQITQHCLQKLGIVLQRGNVAHFTTRIPSYCDPTVNGDLDVDC